MILGLWLYPALFRSYPHEASIVNILAGKRRPGRRCKNLQHPAKSFMDTMKDRPFPPILYHHRAGPAAVPHFPLPL